MLENVDVLIDQGRWKDLIACGSDSVDPLLNALNKTLEQQHHLEDELVVLIRTSDPSDYYNIENHKIISESIPLQEKIINIISALGKIQDVRAWNPLINLINMENYEWPNQLLFDAVKEIESSFQGLKQKQNIYCTKCFHKFVRYPQISLLVCLLTHKRRLCNLTEETWFIPLYHSGPFPVCRNCKGNTNYLEDVSRVTLLLGNMDAPFIFNRGTLTVNWFSVKKPVDMNEIVINDCTNDDITELVIKLKNDDDPCRKGQYKKIPVFLSENLDLSLAKRNLLKNTFANIKIVERDTIRSGG
jgi:hypothetical protein